MTLGALMCPYGYTYRTPTRDGALHNAIDELVKIAWEKKVCSRYRDMISEIKRKGKKPNFIDPDLSERCQCYWNTPKAKKIHETYSKNRMSKATNGARPSTHTRGTATH